MGREEVNLVEILRDREWQLVCRQGVLGLQLVCYLLVQRSLVPTGWFDLPLILILILQVIALEVQ